VEFLVAPRSGESSPEATDLKPAGSGDDIPF
jgi:hypothetical protein